MNVDITKLSPDLQAKIQAELAQQTSKPVVGLTHIHMILDRTGSMESIKEDTIGGVNTFITEQQKVPGKCTFSLVQFDSQDPYEVIADFIPMTDAKTLTNATYQPRASTPLYDAVCKGIVDCTDKCAKRTEVPERILFVIITDGQENASREWDKARMVKLIDEKKTAGWQFVFLGVGIDAMSDGASFGISANTTMSSARSARGTKHMYAAMSAHAVSYRTAATKGAADASLSFTADERKVQEDEGAVKASTP